MFFVGIDQHKRHLTISVRDEQGNIVLRRQISTKWEHVDHFIESLQVRSESDGGFVAVMEVCGFNGWLLERLKRWGCKREYVITAPDRLRQKTDRRDAAKLSELLWINRDRIAADEKLVHVKVVYQPSAEEQYDRQLTHLRHRLGTSLTRAKNSIKGILRRHNLEQECPTKGGFTLAALRWLDVVELPELDRLELNIRLQEFHLFAKQLAEVTSKIEQRTAYSSRVRRVRTMPGVGSYTALALLAHIGPVERFPHARSLCNYFGITPGCRNSGQSDRPGSITKAGHPLIRFLLAQMVLHALRRDAGLRRWYQKVKRRRGSKVARVAVMRRLCESLWHMLKKKEDYKFVNDRVRSRQAQTRPAA